MRLGLVAAIALAGLAAALPGAGARGAADVTVAEIADPALLYPAPLSSGHFSHFYSGGPLGSAEAASPFLNGS